MEHLHLIPWARLPPGFLLADCTCVRPKPGSAGSVTPRTCDIELRAARSSVLRSYQFTVGAAGALVGAKVPLRFWTPGLRH